MSEPALTITPNGGSAITFTAFTGDGSDLLAANKFWRNRPRILTPQYGRDEFKGPYAAGKNMRRNNFDSRWIDNITVLYVDISEANVLTNIENDKAAIMNVQGGCVLALPGWPATIPTCECYDFEPMLYVDGQVVKPTGLGTPATWRAKVMMRFKQLRLQ